MGCSASSAEDVETGDDAVTGVTDLTEMEAGLGLFKDEKDAAGKWSRSEAKLQAGPCYQKLMKGPEAASYQLRRYSSGAAFFKKLGAGAASGDERPVLCVDVDVWYDGAKDSDTIAVSDFEIDAVLRYRLGAPTGGDGAAGSYYDGFKNGWLRYSGWACPTEGFQPLAKSALETYCFGGAEFPGSNDPYASAMIVAYQYAWKHASKTNRFSASGDAIGRFVSMDGDQSFAGQGTNKQHIRFEKLDIHVTEKDGAETIAITPKNSDAAPEASAIVLCKRTRGETPDGDPKATASCRGL